MNASAKTSTFRFAPSPTGRLHLGNMRTALINALMARARDGRFVLRYDDTDRERSREEFARGIADDLKWLGIEPDMSVRQSDRIARYDEAAHRLRDAGLLYPCYETPDELERRRKRALARGLPPIYDRAALKLSGEERAAFEAEGRQAHWRFLLPNHQGDAFKPGRTDVHWHDLIVGPQTVDLGSLSDPVLIREDGSYLYTLPSVVDDGDLEVTDVVRGADHITNTGVQIALFEALGLAVPRFGHHNLLLGSDGKGLSKRTDSASIADLREAGYEPEAVAAIAVLTGTSQPVQAALLVDMAKTFEPSIISSSPARFSSEELATVNAAWLHELPYEAVWTRLEAVDCDLGEPFWLAIRPNLEWFADVTIWASIVRGGFEAAAFEADDREFLKTAAELLPASLEGNAWSRWTGELKVSTDRKGRALFMPLRKALTGRERGPEMAELLPLMDRASVLARLKA